MDERTPEDWLEDYHNGRVTPLGRALRTTFDADNHDTLGNDVTGLMIDLSKIPYGDEGRTAPRPAASAHSPVASAPPAPSPRPSLFAWVADLFGRRAV